MKAGNRRRQIYLVVKRCLDFIVSIVGLLAFAPLFILLFVLIWSQLGCPVFFIQTRPGLQGKPFKMFKFRTMKDTCDPCGKLLPDQMRTPRMGRFMRKTSLDELPEFFNVLKGDMSIVGPRPLLIKYVPYFTDRESKRHYVRPGITGLSQISGRNLLTWNERLELDVKYVENISIFLDIKIFFMTIFQVIRQKDVLAVSSEVIPDFDDYRINQLNNHAFRN